MSHRRRPVLRAAILFPLLSWLLVGSVAADVPHLIRYQGTAVDSQGVPLEGPYTLTFRLYGAESSGTKIWEETQPEVPLTQGHFSVLLGSVTPLNSMDWSHPCWLAILVNGEELLPRQPITSVPLAIRSEAADTATVAHRLAEPITTSTIADDDHSLVPSGAIILWDGASCPAGYTRVINYDDRFLVGSSTAGTTGGSNTHDHGGATGSHVLTVAEMPSHQHTTPAHFHAITMVGQWTGNTTGLQLRTANANSAGSFNTDTDGAGTSGAMGGDGGHTHTIAPADSRPAFRTVLLCKKD